MLRVKYRARLHWPLPKELLYSRLALLVLFRRRGQGHEPNTQRQTLAAMEGALGSHG